MEEDRNTRFFHTRMIIRRRRNRIECLHTDEGTWIQDSEQLQKLLVDFCRSLFHEKNSARSPLTFSNVYHSIPKIIFQGLNLRFSFEEIKEAFFSIGPLRAPGEDGILAFFYKEFWDKLNQDIFTFVLIVCQDPHLVEDFNKTLLVLIP